MSETLHRSDASRERTNDTTDVNSSKIMAATLNNTFPAADASATQAAKRQTNLNVATGDGSQESQAAASSDANIEGNLLNNESHEQQETQLTSNKKRKGRTAPVTINNVTESVLERRLKSMEKTLNTTNGIAQKALKEAQESRLDVGRALYNQSQLTKTQTLLLSNQRQIMVNQQHIMAALSANGQLAAAAPSQVINAVSTNQLDLAAAGAANMPELSLNQMTHHAPTYAGIMQSPETPARNVAAANPTSASPTPASGRKRKANTPSKSHTAGLPPDLLGHVPLRATYDTIYQVFEDWYGLGDAATNPFVHHGGMLGLEKTHGSSWRSAYVTAEQKKFSRVKTVMHFIELCMNHNMKLANDSVSKSTIQTELLLELEPHYKALATMARFAKKWQAEQKDLPVVASVRANLETR
ncbi:hypothetical protein MPSEU_000163600 [Mayamaea pseudoterrestris]|nr:hypothetical protein MPSEU_000163600 [Mayamaea pseudoterrestris]